MTTFKSSKVPVQVFGIVNSLPNLPPPLAEPLFYCSIILSLPLQAFVNAFFFAFSSWQGHFSSL
jgi:hypothetical protein